MINFDPDVLCALKALSVSREGDRGQRVHQKHLKQLDARFETQMELLIDEVERVIPRSHPDFINVLLLAMVRKVAKQTEEPEFTSFLDEGIPPGSGW